MREAQASVLAHLDSSASRIEIMRTKLEALARPIPYWTAVISPSSFGESVENIFHFSFLVKDGTASMFYDTEANEIMACHPSTLESIGVKASSNQLLINITYAIWEVATR